VELTLERDTATPKVEAVRDQIHQVVLNLVLNALAVTPAEGRIRVRTSPSEGGGAEIEISDTGPGIPREHLEQIFDPFFTTRGPDEGTGLGLMVCHRIVTDHGGTIEVHSREGEGASFRVSLPLTAPSDPA
jgi:signal transduction histidine kinase